MTWVVFVWVIGWIASFRSSVTSNLSSNCCITDFNQRPLVSYATILKLKKKKTVLHWIFKEINQWSEIALVWPDRQCGYFWEVRYERSDGGVLSWNRSTVPRSRDRPSNDAGVYRVRSRAAQWHEEKDIDRRGYSEQSVIPSIIFGVFASNYSQRIADKLGFHVLHEVRYDDYASNGRKMSERIGSVHKTARLQVLKL